MTLTKKLLLIKILFMITVTVGAQSSNQPDTRRRGGKIGINLVHIAANNLNISYETRRSGSFSLQGEFGRTFTLFPDMPMTGNTASFLYDDGITGVTDSNLKSRYLIALMPKLHLSGDHHRWDHFIGFRVAYVNERHGDLDCFESYYGLEQNAGTWKEHHVADKLKLHLVFGSERVLWEGTKSVLGLQWALGMGMSSQTFRQREWFLKGYDRCEDIERYGMGLTMDKTAGFLFFSGYASLGLTYTFKKPVD